MSAFDDLTLGEVDELQTIVLGGKSIANGDPVMIAGGVMWMTARKLDPTVTWDQFKATTSMRAIKDFSMQMEADNLDPFLPARPMTT